VGVVPETDNSRDIVEQVHAAAREHGVVRVLGIRDGVVLYEAVNT
jgi:hypothetical protein